MEKPTEQRADERGADSVQRLGSAYWPLFKHMSDNHGLTLLDSEMEDICRVVLKMRIPTNWLHPLLSGPESVLPIATAGKWGCPDIERLLNAIRGVNTPNERTQRQQEAE